MSSRKITITYDGINEIENDAYNKALEDFSKEIVNYKPQDEEYRSFEDAVNEVKNRLYK